MPTERRRGGRRRSDETDEDLWARLGSEFPSLAQDDPWGEALDNPHMLGGLVRALVKVAVPQGRGTRELPDLDEARAIVADLRGEYATDPFPIAFHQLCGHHSAAGVAARTGIDRYKIIRLRKPPGHPQHQTPSVTELAAIARGYRRSPMFFTEYRMAALLAAVATTVSPEQSATLVRHLTAC